MKLLLVFLFASTSALAQMSMNAQKVNETALKLALENAKTLKTTDKISLATHLSKILITGYETKSRINNECESETMTILKCALRISNSTAEDNESDTGLIYKVMTDLKGTPKKVLMGLEIVTAGGGQ